MAKCVSKLDVFNGEYVLGVDNVSWREKATPLRRETSTPSVGVIKASPIVKKKLLFLSFFSKGVIDAL